MPCEDEPGRSPPATTYRLSNALQAKLGQSNARAKFELSREKVSYLLAAALPGGVQSYSLVG
jgi:hypothetical protein